MKRQLAPSPGFSSGLTAALCAASFALLMTAVILSERRQVQQQAQQGWALLRSEVHRLLDRPNLLDPALFDELEIASRDASELEKNLRPGMFDVADRSWLSDLKTISATLKGLARLRSSFDELGEQSADDETTGSTLSVGSLPDLCGRDASVANMPRLRMLLDERLARGNEVGLDPLPELAANAGAPPLQKALQLADRFRTSRGEALGLLDSLNLRPPSVLGQGWILNLAASGAIVGLLALLHWRIGVLRVEAQPADEPTLPVTLPMEPGMVYGGDAPGSEAAVTLLAPVDPVPDESAPGPWLEIGLNLGHALDLSGVLEAQALALIDGVFDDAQVTYDEAVTALVALADHLRAAREATVNTGLSLLADMPVHERVTEFGRLDQQLQAILEVVQRLQSLHVAEEAAAHSTSVVKRVELIQLHNELSHLCGQLAVIHKDVQSTLAFSLAS
jgi:hypothetical protein